jgi:hypothetical protein
VQTGKNDVVVSAATRQFLGTPRRYSAFPENGQRHTPCFVDDVESGG